MAKKDKGFTIIEVALVLAIAGLIFLVVFLALPALQRSQRDTARRQEVGNVVSALQQYTSDNQGTNATTWAQISGYLGGGDGKQSQLTSGIMNQSGSASTITGTSYAYISAAGNKCGASGELTTSTNTRQQAVRTKLESGGVYCQNM